VCFKTICQLRCLSSTALEGVYCELSISMHAGDPFPNVCHHQMKLAADWDLTVTWSMDCSGRCHEF